METRSQKIDRQYKTQRALLMRLQSIYCAAIQLKQTADHISDQTCKLVFHSQEAKTITRSQLEYLHGYNEAKRHDLYQNHLIWMMWVDSKLMSSKDISRLEKNEAMMFQIAVNGIVLNTGNKPDIDYISPWRRVNGDLCRHVWKDANGNPLPNKPFDAKFLEKKEEDKCMTP
jgi:hypothetical protein